MLPVTTPDEMGAIDRGAADPVEVLIRRAGDAVAYEARALLGGIDNPWGAAIGGLIVGVAENVLGA